MKSFARTCLALGLILSSYGCGEKIRPPQETPARPAEPPDANPGLSAQDEQKAREITETFLKALRAKNVDALLKTTTLPFLAEKGGKQIVLQSQAEVKAWLQDAVGAITDPQKVASEVVRVEPLPPSKRAANPQEQADIDLAVKTIGGSGYFVLVKGDDFMVLVARKNGQVLVAGVVP